MEYQRLEKQNKSCFVCQITVSVQRLWTKAWPATALLILLMRESQKRKDAFDAKDTASAAVEKTLVNANEKGNKKKTKKVPAKKRKVDDENDKNDLDED